MDAADASLAVAGPGRMRTARRQATDPYAVLAERLSARQPVIAAPPVAAALEAPTPEPSADLWNRLAARLDPGQERPKLADDIEMKEFHLRWGNDYAMLANPRTFIYYRFEPGEVELIRLMDGTRTVKQIVLDRLQESGDLELSGVSDLVATLRRGSFLDPPFVDTTAAVAEGLHPVSPVRRKAREFVKTLSIDWSGAEPFFRSVYGSGVKWFFTKPLAIASAAVALIGLAAFASVQMSGGFELGDRSAIAESLVLIALGYVLTFIHELGHAAALVHYGRRIKSAGFMLYFGSPAFFIEATDSLMMERGPRILQSFGGPFAEAVATGAAAIVLWTFPDWTIAELLFRFCLINYFVLFLNLIPLLELDGYWILADAIQVPDLRPRSMRFVRYELWSKLRNRERISPQELGLTLYSLAGIAFTILLVYSSVFFWWRVFGGMVTQLWEGGVWTRLLLVALALFFAGPVLRAMIAVARTVVRRVRAIVRRVRFHFEREWRVEAAKLIDSLPIFDDVPVDVLNDLAGRVHLRSVPAGAAVVRQGEPADAFYLVRRGTLDVVEEDPSSNNERVLRVLGRGESFGELGVSQGARRAATVRAAEESEVFQIDKGTFDRLLADMVDVPDFAPTLQAVEELRGLACFDQLEPDELRELLEHGAWVNVAPGEEVIRQGEQGDAFYAIGSGRFEVVKDGEAVEELGPGAFFGEIALLHDVPRTATVAAKTPARVYRLDRAGFDALMAEALRGGTLRPGGESDRTETH